MRHVGISNCDGRLGLCGDSLPGTFSKFSITRAAPCRRAMPSSKRSETTSTAVLDWLLDSDPSIRWQVQRDLTDATAHDVGAERARVATEGFGARLLALQADDGTWGNAAWNHGWDFTMHVLPLLRDLGLNPACEQSCHAMRTQFAFPTWWHYDVLRGLEYLRAAGAAPDPRLADAIALVESKRDGDGVWRLDVQYAGTMPIATGDRVGEPSRWLTLRAMRVLEWFYSAAATPTRIQ